MSSGAFFLPRFAKACVRARFRVRAYTHVRYHTCAQKCAQRTRVNTSHARLRAHDLIQLFGITCFFTLRKLRENVIFSRNFQQKNAKQKFKLYDKEINLLLHYISVPFVKFLKFLKKQKSKKKGERGRGKRNISGYPLKIYGSCKCGSSRRTR